MAIVLTAGHRPVGTLGPLTLHAVVGGLGVAAAWVLCHPYFGTADGSLIYIARAMASLDPAGVGQDAMFKLDGQSGFTLFTPAFLWLASKLGLDTASRLTAALALGATLVGSACLASQIAHGRARIIAMLFIAAFPAAYGGYGIFSYLGAEVTPRPFAEALVLGGVAALVAGRKSVAVIAIGAAVLLHPIMAMPGAVLLLCWFIIGDRRWLIPALVAGVAILWCGFIGIAPFDRLFVVVDPEWLEVLKTRNPLLFPGLWLDGWIGRFATRILTLVIAATFVPPPVRRLMHLSIAIAFVGIIGTYLFGERVPLLLVVQMQPWRAAWLLFVIAAAAAAVCCHALWTRGGISRVTLACLALAWISPEDDRTTLLLAVTTLAIHLNRNVLRDLVSDRSVTIIVSGIGVLLIASFLIRLHAHFSFVPGITWGDGEEIRRLFARRFDLAIPVMFLGLVLVERRAFRDAAETIALLACLAAAPWLILNWDQRGARTIALDSAEASTALQRLVASTPGEVYWINGTQEAWSWLGRPNWVSAIQGAAIVFNRDLAIRFRERARRVVELGLADDDLRTPLTEPHAVAIPLLTSAKLADFCAKADAPAWIIAPSVDDHVLPDGVTGAAWRAPVPKYEFLQVGSALQFHRIDRYWVVRCAGA